MIPSSEEFQTKATNLYAQIRNMDRDTAIYVLTKELLLAFRDGGVSALTETRTALAERRTK